MGQPLFPETKITKILQRHALWDLPDLSALPRTPDDWCRSLLEQCLQRNPSKRRPDLHLVASWAEPVDVRLLADHESKSAQTSWEDDTILG
jgi:hypothetical protein